MTLEDLILKAGELGALGLVTVYVLTRMTTAINKLTDSNKALADSVKILADKVNNMDTRVSYLETHIESRLDKIVDGINELKTAKKE